jgi:hypothetical protein
MCIISGILVTWQWESMEGFSASLPTQKGNTPETASMTTDLLDSILLCYTVLLQSSW